MHDIIEQNDSPLARSSGMMDVESNRATAAVQAAMVVAKRFPRDESRAIERIRQSCKRPLLAGQAIYAYPRGNETVEGPSIRLAEVLARSWGNLECGVVELERREGESVCQAYCWDLETNTKDSKVFTVRHIRDKRTGNVPVTGERDIYELIANMGARRKRATILSVIPGDIVEMALQECEKTMAGQNTEPLLDRVRAAAGAFAEFNVSVGMLESRLGHHLDVTRESELSQLRKIYRSIKDGAASVEDFFSAEATNKSPMGAKAAEKTAEKPPKKNTVDAATAAAADPAPVGTVTPADPQPAGGAEAPTQAPATPDAPAPADGELTEEILVAALLRLAPPDLGDDAAKEIIAKRMRIGLPKAWSKLTKDSRQRFYAEWVTAGEFWKKFGTNNN